MENPRIQTKVGLFVLVTLVLLGALLVIFSKGVTRFTRTYELHLLTTDVGSLKKGSGVLMSGYMIGNVTEIDLGENGESVEVVLQIKRKYQVRTNAVFIIEQAGFLGDQYVAVYPSTNRTARFFKDGERAVCPPPFNLQAVARNAAGFIERIDQTAQRLNGAIDDVRRLVLNEQTLTNLATTVDTMRAASERARVTIDDINNMVATNRAPLAATLSNLVVFSSQMEQASANVNGLISTNGQVLGSAVKNIESSTVILESLLGDIQSGKGLAGTLLKNEAFAGDVEKIAQNLSVTTSNLNRLGLWGILWRAKEPRTNASPVQNMTSPKSPFH
jgi:phospholipid/cholesterol/gamma-HCH transport system substrate-binding protein